MEEDINSREDTSKKPLGVLDKDFEINLENFKEEEIKEDSFEEEDEEESEPLANEEFEYEEESESIEDIVADTPTQNIPMASTFAPQQFVSPQSTAISPVLERQPIAQPTNLEDELPEMQTTQPEIAGQQAQAYEAGSDYYASSYQSTQDYPEVQAINPTLNPNFSKIQGQPRFHQTDTSWGTPKHQDLEKKYDIKFADTKRKRRLQ